jgi:5-methylcytosine-specific restriction protein A
MPAYPCRSPTCSEYVTEKGGVCGNHTGRGVAPEVSRHRRYDEARRDREAKRFYDSAAWQRARRERLAEHPVCERCGRAWAAHVHHVKPLRDYPALALDRNNHEAICAPCHNKERDARTR